MSVKIKTLKADDVLFCNSTMTLDKFRSIIVTIKNRLGNIPICFFFSNYGDITDYKNERYINGVFNVDIASPTGLNLCAAMSSSEALLHIDDVESMLDRIVIGSKVTSSLGEQVEITDSTILRIGARSQDELGGDIVELLVVEDMLYIFTSTATINWDTEEESVEFGTEIVNWFFEEYCSDINYNDIHRVAY